MEELHHGWLCLEELSLDGTWFLRSYPDQSANQLPAASCSISVVGEWVLTNSSTHSLDAALNLSKSTEFQRRILRWVGLCLEARTLVSKKTASWSLSPGQPEHLLSRDGRFVNTRSSVCFPLLGKSTSWSRPAWTIVWRKVSLIGVQYQCPVTWSFFSVGVR